jgi:hypothetical protein
VRRSAALPGQTTPGVKSAVRPFTYCKPPIEHQFKPGQGGRKKRSRNKLGEDFLLALADDFERHGAEAIKRVRIEKPGAYLKVIASLLPKDLNLNVTKYDDLTDEQLIVRLKILTEQAASTLGRLIDHDPADDDDSAVPAPEREEDGLVGGVAADSMARSSTRAVSCSMLRNEIGVLKKTSRLKQRC